MLSSGGWKRTSTKVSFSITQMDGWPSYAGKISVLGGKIGGVACGNVRPRRRPFEESSVGLPKLGRDTCKFWPLVKRFTIA